MLQELNRVWREFLEFSASKHESRIKDDILKQAISEYGVSKRGSPEGISSFRRRQIVDSGIETDYLIIERAYVLIRTRLS